MLPKRLIVTALCLICMRSALAAISKPISEKQAQLFSVRLITTNSHNSVIEKSQTMPEEALKLLAKHSRWQSIPYMKVSVTDSYQIFTERNKKWRTVIRSNEAVSLQETTALSIVGQSSDPTKFESRSIHVDLTKPFSIGDFYIPFSKPLAWRVVRLKGDKFVIRSLDESINVIFIPSMEDVDSHRFKIERMYPNASTLTAPLGFIAEGYDREPMLPKLRQTHYYHHASKDHKQVVIEPNFPKEFHPTVVESLKKWNRALGRSLFSLHPETRSFDPAECLSEQMLCIYWSGTSEVAWNGMTAMTAVSFDPQTGRSLGGLISVFNQAPQSLEDTPTELAKPLTDGSFDLNWVARISLKRETFGHYRNPEPEKFLEYFLVHELGHYNGLKHNFMGSRDGSAEHPTKSIMDYLPFPIVSRSTEIGVYDRHVLDLIYRRIPYPADLPYCGDYDHTDKEGVPGCDLRDVGDSIAWYSILAHESPKGLMTNYASFGPNDDPNKLLIDEILKFKRDPERQRAVDLMCRFEDAELVSYLTSKNVALACPNGTALAIEQ